MTLMPTPKIPRYLDSQTLGNLRTRFTPEVIEALKEKFCMAVESFEMHRDDEIKRMQKVKKTMEIILRKMTLEQMPFSRIWAGYFGLRLEGLERYLSFLERTIRKAPNPRTGPNTWKLQTLALT